MKKKHLFLTALTLGLIFTACKKEDIDPNSSTGNNNDTTTTVIDSMALDSLEKICTDFDDSTDFFITSYSGQSEFGSEDLTFEPRGFKVKSRYVDYSGDADTAGIAMEITYGINQTAHWNSNFSHQIIGIWDLDIQISLKSGNFTNEKVSFDISNNYDLSAANPFQVNGSSTGALPAGITMNLINLGPAGNGNDCFRVELNGPVESLIIGGDEVFIDNLCIERK